MWQASSPGAIGRALPRRGSTSKRRWASGTGTSQPPNRRSRTPLNWPGRRIFRNGGRRCRRSSTRRIDMRRLRRARGKSGNRLILLDIPAALPIEAASAWRRWQGIGRPLKLDLAASGQSAWPIRISSRRFTAVRPLSIRGLLDAARRSCRRPRRGYVGRRGRQEPGGRCPRGRSRPPRRHDAILLSYARLDAYRESFSHEMNTMRKDLADADAVFDHCAKSM